jgi:DNA-binding Lrp family transcriptional regulator
MTATKRIKKTGERVSYSFVEFAEMVGKERTWVYRQVKKGRIRAITGFGAALIPASEIDRIFGGKEGI